MKIRNAWFFSLTSMASVFSPLACAQEEAHPTVNSEEFTGSLERSLSALEQRQFGEELLAPGFGAVTSSEFADALKAIKTTWNTLVTERGSPKVLYDVIIQAGHYRRTTGATGTEGLLIKERELTAYLVKGIVEQLKKNRSLKVLALSADEFNAGLRSKLFLAIHADGSTVQCSTGPSLSYQKNSSTLAMHAIGWGLGTALGYRYDEFRKDGFTADSARYYMFSQIDAPVMKGLLEVGELTCKYKEEMLILSADKIAANVARAIEFVHNTSSGAGR